MEQSILTSTKKILGISPEYTAFDPDILTHIGSTLALMSQLGLGLPENFVIEDASKTWEDLALPPDQLGFAKTYIYLKVRLVFDPPATSFHLEAMNKQIEEHEMRLSYLREDLIPLPEEPTEEVQPIW